MPVALDLHALAREMKAAQDAARQIELFTTRLPDLGSGGGRPGLTIEFSA